MIIMLKELLHPVKQCLFLGHLRGCDRGHRHSGTTPADVQGDLHANTPRASVSSPTPPKLFPRQNLLTYIACHNEICNPCIAGRTPAP